MSMHRGRARSVTLAFLSMAALAVGPVTAAAALPATGTLPIRVAVQGFEVGMSPQGVMFAGQASTGGGWSATLAVSPPSPTGSLPTTLKTTGGTLSLSLLGQALTLPLPASTLTLSPNATTTSSTYGLIAPVSPGQVACQTAAGGSTAPAAASPACPSTASSTGPSTASSTGSSTASSTGSSTASSTGSSTASAAASSTASAAGSSTASSAGSSSASATGAVVPESAAAAEEMLQIYSGAWHDAQGNTKAQQELAGFGQQLETAVPALQALGKFPLPEADVVLPPRVIAPDWSNNCGDTAYQLSMRLSVAKVASGTFQGQYIVYRTPTATGCATYASAITGEVMVTSLFGQTP